MRYKLSWMPISIIFLLLLLYGCQTEDVIVDAEAHSEITRKTITLEEMSRYVGAVEKINPFIRKKNTNLNKKLVYDEKFGFWVDTDQIMMMQKDEHITFTMPVYRAIENGKTENLVLNLKENGDYTVLLFKYALTDQDKQDIKNNVPIFNLFTKTEVDILSYDNPQTNASVGGGPYVGQIHQAEDGSCYRVDHITQISENIVQITYVGVNCPEGFNNPTFTEDGGGSGGGAPMPVWYPVPTSGNGGDGPAVGNNGGGFGGSGSNDNSEPETEPVITGPVVPNELDPCEIIKKLEIDPEFQEKMLVLQAATNQPFEKVFTAYNFLNANNVNDKYNYLDFTGSNNKPVATYDIVLNHANKFKGVMHSHYQGLLSVFSTKDLQDFYKNIKNDAFSDDLFTVLVTKSGTRYMLMVSNKAAFISFGDTFLATDRKLEILGKKYENKYYITETGSNAVNEKGFVKMLAEMNAGLNTYSGDATFTNWQKLTYNSQSNNVVPSECD